MATVNNNIDMVRGDTLAYTITIDGEIGTITNIRMTARRCQTDVVLFEAALGDEITESGGVYTVRIPPSATADAKPGQYDYDVEFTIGDDVYTVMRGILNLYKDQSR